MAKETLYPIKKLVSLTEDQAAQVSDFRFSARLNSENEAIRRLIGIGLGAEPLLRDLIAWLDSGPFQDAETQALVARLKEVLGED